MACCAFAIFLLSHLLLPLQRVRDFLFGAPVERDNPAVAWTFAAATMAPPNAPSPRWRRFATPLAFAATAELLFAGGAVAVVSQREPDPQTYATGLSEQTFLDALHRSICSSVGLSNETPRP